VLAQTAVFRNVRVVSMNDERVVDGMAVVVRDGRISEIAPADEVETPPSAREIDGTGGYLMPGLVDAHMHLRHRDELLNYVAHGVTTVLGLGQPVDDLEELLVLRREVADGTRLGPRIYTTGGVIALHVDPENPAEARAYVRKLKADGFDLVKIYNRTSREVFDAVVDEAHRQGLAVFGHLPRGLPATYSLANGIDVVAHAEELYFTFFGGPSDDELGAFSAADVPDPDASTEVIDLMREHDVALIPNLVFTFVAMKFWDNEDAVLAEPEMAFLHPTLAASWRVSNPGRRDQISKRMLRERIKYGLIHELTRRAHEAGVMVVAGTDSSLAGLHPGLSLHSEMRELVKAGFTDFEALAAATSTAGELVARYVDHAARIGRIEPGYEADLVLVADNPLADIRNAAEVLGVMADGRWHSADELSRLRSQRIDRYGALRGTAAAIRTAVSAGQPAAEIRRMIADLGKGDPEFLEFGRETVETIAESAYREGDLAELLRVAALNTAIFPDSVETWDLLGQVHEELHDRGRALAAYRRALEVDPSAEHARQQVEAIERRPSSQSRP
jgi:hypothetical protein